MLARPARGSQPEIVIIEHVEAPTSTSRAVERSCQLAPAQLQPASDPRSSGDAIDFGFPCSLSPLASTGKEQRSHGEDRPETRST